jgi:hypothetical protein
MCRANLSSEIYTSRILQRKPGDESPFKDLLKSSLEGNISILSCPFEMKTGCDGFGIRNFFPFLSIEVGEGS